MNKHSDSEISKLPGKWSDGKVVQQLCMKTCNWARFWDFPKASARELQKSLYMKERLRPGPVASLILGQKDEDVGACRLVVGCVQDVVKDRKQGIAPPSPRGIVIASF